MVESRPRILLTGASGFVGRQILHSLRETEMSVVAVARDISGHEGDPAWCALDLHDISATRRLLEEVKPSLCIHSAWSVADREFWRSPENSRWVESSVQLAESFVAAGGRRFVGLGTQAEYPDRPGIFPEDEAVESPSTPYGAAKDATRRRVENLCRDHHVSFVWARVFNVFGPGEADFKLIPSVIHSLAAGKTASISSGRSVRDFIDVRDVGSGIAALALSNVEGAVNIGTGNGRKIIDVASEVASLMKARDRLLVGALPDRPGECLEIVADIERLKTEVGFRAFRPFSESLRETIAHFS